MKWLLIITVVVMFDLLLTIVLLRIVVKVGWSRLLRRYPGADVLPDAVCREFQSFRIGAMSLAGCIHVAADERHLHLQPALLLRWAGAAAASIPWDSITLRDRARHGRWATAEVDDLLLHGPSWCLNLARPGETPESDTDGR